MSPLDHGGRRFGLTPDGPSPMISVRLPKTLLEHIDQYALQHDIKRADAIRELLLRATEELDTEDDG